jgi:tRNA U54 and U55 pseudouridine synthase Pus10
MNQGTTIPRRSRQMTAPIQNNVLDTAISILEQYSICDRCLGRQFAWLSTNTSNSERGHSLKLVLSMIADDELKSENPEHGRKIINLFLPRLEK